MNLKDLGTMLSHEKNHWTEPYEPWIGYFEYGAFVAFYLWMVW